MRSEDEEKLWTARAEYFQWQLSQPHDQDWYDAAPGVLPQPPQYTWGTRRVQFRTVERNYKKAAPRKRGMLPSRKMTREIGNCTTLTRMIRDFSNGEYLMKNHDVSAWGKLVL